MVYVAMRSVPMGWIGAVDVMQCMARRLVFGFAGVDPATELRKDAAVPADDIAVVCMDGFNFVRKIRAVTAAASSQGSEEHARFVKECDKLKLPLNVGKRLVSGALGHMLGGELDGVLGSLSVDREKVHRLIVKSLALLSLRAVPQAALQHWAGIFCFAANFRRPAYSVLQEVFAGIVAAGPGAVPSGFRGGAIIDEVVCGVGLLPFCRASLRAGIRRVVSASDASESGGGASEARSFLESFDVGGVALLSARAAGLTEESSQPVTGPLVCSECGTCCDPSPSPARPERATRAGRYDGDFRCAGPSAISSSFWGGARCPALCSATLCSSACFRRHLGVDRPCRRAVASLPAAVVQGLPQQREVEWGIERAGLRVADLAQEPMAALRVWLVRGGTLRAQAWQPRRARTRSARDAKVLRDAIADSWRSARDGRVCIVVHPANSWQWSLPDIVHYLQSSGASRARVCHTCFGTCSDGALCVVHNSSAVGDFLAGEACRCGALVPEGVAWGGGRFSCLP